MKELTVEIKEIHIDIGDFCCPGTCPVAFGINEALGYHGPERKNAIEVAHEGEFLPGTNVLKYGVYQRRRDVKGGWIRIADLPEEACRWIYAADFASEELKSSFDRGMLKPFSFVLKFDVEPI